MRVAQMPFVSWDKQKSRAVYQRRFPKDVQPLTGAWFRYKFPTRVSLRNAGDLSHEQTAEFAALVEAARQSLMTPEGVRAAARLSRERLAGIRQRIAELWRGPFAAIDRKTQRLTDEAALHRLGARMGVTFTSPEPLRIVDTEEVLTAWTNRRINANRPPKPRAVTNKRNKVSQMLAHLRRSHMGAVTEAGLKAYQRHLEAKGATEGKPSLANDHLKEIKPLFALAHELDLMSFDPAEKIKPPTRERNTRPPFSDAEAQMILEAARVSDDPVIRWSNWLAGFTTAINSEILEAHESEFYQLPGRQWVWDMRGRQLKTGFRPRMVPLPPAIIVQEDFPAYLATRAGKTLFAGNPATNSNRLNAFIHGLDIEKTFYSWRHRVIHWLDHRIPKEKKLSASLSRYVAGHAAPDIHEAFYSHHAELVGELAQEFDDIVEAIKALKDPTQQTAGHTNSTPGTRAA